MSLIESLNWRYAVKNYKNQTVQPEKLDQILESIRLTPTSLGLQTFKVFLIENPEVRNEMSSKVCKQPQTVEAGHLLVFAAYSELRQEQIDEYMLRIANTRNQELSELEKFKMGIQGFTSKMESSEFRNWCAKQTYIAMGIAMTVAAQLEVDTTPMEGFDNKAMDELLQLEKQGLFSTVMLAVGHRDSEKDFLAKAKKVRKSKEQLIFNI
jgi:nitroreductase/dihydropteridine reductase